MDSESLNGKMEMNIKDHFVKVSNMEKEEKNLQMVIFIKEPTKKASPVAMASIFGSMEASIRENLKMDLNMGKENI